MSTQWQFLLLPLGKVFMYFWVSYDLCTHFAKVHHFTNISLSLLALYFRCLWRASTRCLRVVWGACYLGWLSTWIGDVWFSTTSMYISETVFSFRTFWLVSHPGQTIQKKKSGGSSLSMTSGAIKIQARMGDVYQLCFCNRLRWSWGSSSLWLIWAPLLAQMLPSY